MNTIFLKRICAGVALASLIGCGGSSSGGDAGGNLQLDEAPQRLLAVDVGTLGAALQSGETLSAQGPASAAILRNYDNQSSSTVSDVLVQVVQNEAGELSLFVNGEGVAFSAADRNDRAGTAFGYEIDTPASFFALRNRDGNLDTLLAANNGNARPVTFYFEPDDGSTAFLGTAILGTETAVVDVPTSGAATFTGSSAITLFPATDLTNFNDTREALRSDVTLNVNFAENTLSGQMTNLERQDPPNAGDARTDIAGTITMEAATLSDGVFAGALTLDAAGVAATPFTNSDLGTYAGTFYGTAAQQAAGTISVSAPTDNGALNGHGFFTTSR